MADNFDISDRTNTLRTLRTKDTGTAHIPHHIVEGALSVAHAPVTATTTAGTLVAARTGRKSVTITNNDASIACYIGAATVTSANGYKLAAGQSVTLTWQGLIQCLAASSTVLISVWDEFY